MESSYYRKYEMCSWLLYRFKNYSSYIKIYKKIFVQTTKNFFKVTTTSEEKLKEKSEEKSVTESMDSTSTSEHSTSESEKHEKEEKEKEQKETLKEKIDRLALENSEDDESFKVSFIFLFCLIFFLSFWTISILSNS